jgi:arylsulfatase A-like enzyme/Tfp pilus assembly protein PilF
MNKARLFITISLLGLMIFLFIPLTPWAYTQPAKNTKQNLLLITIDTLRTDRLSCYSSEHLQTPTIDKWAENGVLFTRAFAHTSTTLPSHTNILCGTTPLYHGVHDNFNFILGPEFLTLAEHLKVSGYNTGAFVGGFPLDSRFGLDQGFDIYDDNFKTRTDIEIQAEFVVDKALSWLELQESPWFCWIHCYDPHDPYSPPEPFKKQHEKDLYNGEVAYVDSTLRKLTDYLDKKDLTENTLIVFTADHGEALDQHGERTHGFFAYNEVIWIPLIICIPGITEGRIDEYVSHVDIFPTVCDVLDIKKPSFLQGISLLPALEGKKISQRILYFESLYPYYSRGWAPLRGFIEKNEKYIDSPIPELYDIEIDFGELNNLAKGKKLESHKKRLGKIMKDQSNPESEKPRKKVDQEALKKLESLGYISNPNISLKENFGPEDDIKTLLPNYNKADLTNKLYENDEISLDDAVESLREVITATQQIDIAYKGLALLYREMGRSKDAVDVLKAGIENHPSSYEILRDLVSYLSELEHYQDVISLCLSNYVVQMDFETDIWNVLGFAYWRTGDLKNAQETYERALSIDDEDPTLLANFGNVYFSYFQKTKESNFRKKAIELFEKAVELDPNLAQAYDGLGIASLVSGDLEKAISYWEKVMDIMPSHTNTVYNLSRAYLTKDEKQKALALLEKFMKTNSHRLSPENKKIFEELIKKCKDVPC